MPSLSATMRMFDARLKRVELLVEAIAKEMGLETATINVSSEPIPRSVLKGMKALDTDDSPPSPDLEATEAAIALAKEKGIDLANIKGTGEGGKILKGDVTRATP